MPLNRRDGSYFGTLCALDTLPATIDEQNLDIFHMLASLIAFELEADDHRRQQAHELAHAREAASRGERFIGVLGHELRTPLAAIKGLSQIMLRRGELSDQSRTDLGRIVASADRLNRLTHDLIDFTRTRIGGEMTISPSAANLAALCHQCLEDVRMEHPNRLIHLETAGDLNGHWDPDRLAQVITNLATNAVRYSPVTSPVEVIARPEEDHVCLQVRNAGEPIQDDELAHIFDPFRQGEHNATNPQHPGSLGLGLSIVKQIVLAHGGTIDASSAAAAGTVFTARLPRNVEASPPNADSAWKDALAP